MKETKENILDKALAVAIVEGEANCKGRLRGKLVTESLSKKMFHHHHHAKTLFIKF